MSHNELFRKGATLSPALENAKFKIPTAAFENARSEFSDEDNVRSQLSTQEGMEINVQHYTALRSFEPWCR